VALHVVCVPCFIRDVPASRRVGFRHTGVRWREGLGAMLST